MLCEMPAALCEPPRLRRDECHVPCQLFSAGSTICLSGGNQEDWIINDGNEIGSDYSGRPAWTKRPEHSTIA